MKDIETVLENKEQAHVLLTAFQTVLDNSTDMVFIKDINLRYLGASMPFVKMVGKQVPEDIIDHTDLEIFEDSELARRYAADDRKLLASGKNLIDFTEPLPEVDGLAHFGITSKYILRDREGTPVGLLGVTRDVTRDVLARQTHRRELDYLFELPPDTYIAIYMDLNDWRILGERKQPVDNYVLPTYDTIDELRAGILNVIPEGTPSRDFFVNFTFEHLRNIYENGQRKLWTEYPRSMPDGTLRWAQGEMTFMIDPDNSHLCMILVVRDIHDRKQEEHQIRQAAERDEMTGLLNRAATMKKIQRFLSGDGADSTHALMIIDVDNFKAINDTYGHRAGDQYLIRFAQTIRGCFRTSDIMGRIGGDEFFVLMKDVSSRSATEERANHLLKSIREVNDFEKDVGVSGSIGVCFYRGNNRTLDQLYEDADQALYEAKRQGKNRVVFANNLV